MTWRSIADVRALLGADGVGLSDDEVAAIRAGAYAFARAVVDCHRGKREMDGDLDTRQRAAAASGD